MGLVSDRLATSLNPDFRKAGNGPYAPFDPNNVSRSLHLSDVKVLNVNVSFIVYIPSPNEVQLRGFQILH